MPVPARRHSRSRPRRRRSHDALKAQNVDVCQNCQAPVLSHRACATCGTYKGKQVRETKQPAATHKHGHEHETKTQDE